MFQHLVLDDMRALGEAINSGRKSFGDLHVLLNEARQFREWLHAKPQDRELVKEYFQEVMRETWLQTLPAKSVRWLLFTALGLAIDSAGAGGAGTLTGLGLSFADAFIMDRALTGWKPDQFVNGSLKAFSRNA